MNTIREIYRRLSHMRQTGEVTLDAKTEGLISQVLDKIYFTHKDAIKIARITLKTQLGCSFQTIVTWDLHADGGYGRYTYVNKNAKEELQKLRSSQKVYKIAYAINDEDEHELVFEPDQS